MYFFFFTYIMIHFLACLIYWQTYINDTLNDCESNLSSERDDSTNLQRIDVAINVQLTPISAIMEYKWSYSLIIMEQQKKKIQKIYLNPQVKNLWKLKLQNNHINFRKTIFVLQFITIVIYFS